MKQLTALKTATLSRSFSILSSNAWHEMFSSGEEQDQSGLAENTVHSIHEDFGIKTGIFGRIERALSVVLFAIRS